MRLRNTFDIAVRLHMPVREVAELLPLFVGYANALTKEQAEQ